jgi:hypothetical protein
VPDVFLSFSEKDRKLAEKTQNALIQRGYDVWSWINKTPGDRTKTDQVQDVAKATIVIWTTNSIASDNVMKEADRAYQLEKLIPLK